MFRKWNFRGRTPHYKVQITIHYISQVSHIFYTHSPTLAHLFRGQNIHKVSIQLDLGWLAT